MARRTRLTKDLQGQIVAALATGVTEDAACRTVSLHPSVYYRWKQRGRLAETHWTRLTPEQQRLEVLYKEFYEAVTRAWHQSHTRLAGAVLSAAVPHETVERIVVRKANGEVEETTRTRREWDWRAAMTILERRFPEDWGKRDRVEVSGPDGGPVQVEAAAVQALREKVDRLRAVEGG